MQHFIIWALLQILKNDRVMVLSNDHVMDGFVYFDNFFTHAMIKSMKTNAMWCTLYII